MSGDLLQWDIGRMRVTAIVEQEMIVPLGRLLRGEADDTLLRSPWLSPTYVTCAGDAIVVVQGFVIDDGQRRILVDTCIGDQREGAYARPSPFLERLAFAGWAPEDISMVVCTHLHFDHVGWNTRLVDGQIVPTFPNACYLCSTEEWHHWSTVESSICDFTTSLRPLEASRQIDLVPSDHRITDRVSLVPTPGHTPGHVCVLIEDEGQRAFITGDMAHSPIQFANTELAAVGDTDPPGAARTRRSFLADRTADGALVIGSHFAPPTAGRIVADGSGWRITT